MKGNAVGLMLFAGALALVANVTCASGTPTDAEEAASVGAASAGGAGGAGAASGEGGARAQCSKISDCPIPSNACVVASCKAGVCMNQNAAAGTVIAKDAVRDCHASVCDGHGQLEEGLDLENTPVSNNPCLVGACDPSGTPGTSFAAAGVLCTTPLGGQRCDGAGECVQCLTSSDCPNGHPCNVLNMCSAPHCMDGVEDGDETDADCGGATCPPCSVGRACKQASDCLSGACDAIMHTCLSPLCSDQQKNYNETDVDCGGSCPACPVGDGCLVDQDCVSQACGSTSHVCFANKCDDQHKDGFETDVDCGGPCPPCALGQACFLDTECAAPYLCEGEVCSINPCFDGMQDNSETGVDCGGVCMPCPLGGGCELDFDCASLACDVDTLMCIGDACFDHRQDGMETDVDCGGPVCVARCAANRRCMTTSDCAAGAMCLPGNPHVCN